MKNKPSTACAEFVAGDDGLEAVEYAVMVGLIVAGTLTAIAAIGIWVVGVYTTTAATLGA